MFFRHPRQSLFCGQFFFLHSFGVTHFLADLTICVSKYWHLRGSERWTSGSVCLSLHLLLLSLCSSIFRPRCHHRQLIRVSTHLRRLHSFVSSAAGASSANFEALNVIPAKHLYFLQKSCWYQLLDIYFIKYFYKFTRAMAFGLICQCVRVAKTLVTSAASEGSLKR